MRRASRLRVLQMLRKELRQIFRDPKSKRVIFVAPVIQLVLFGYAVNTDVHNAALHVVDLDRTAVSRELVDVFVASGHFRVAGRSMDPDAMQRALDTGRAVIGLEIPAGFARDLAAGRGATVQVLVDGTNSNTGTVAQGYATRIVREFGLERQGRPATALDLRARAWYNPDLVSQVYNVPAVIGTLLLLISLLLTALAVVRERELGTLEQLLVSPLTPSELILGKTLPVALIAVVDLALITGVAIAWFGIPLRGSALALLLASMLFILTSLGFGLLISSSAKTQQEAFMLLFMFFLPAAVLSGFMYPIETMPAFFQALTLLNPLRHFLEIVRGIFLKGMGVTDLAFQYSVMAVAAVAVPWLASWRFRRSLEGR